MIPILELTSTSDMGGAERMVLWLSRGLDRSRFEPHVGSLIGSGALVDQCASSDIPAAHFHFHNPVDPAGITRLIRYIRDHKIRIIQTHGLRADSIGRWAARLGGAKAIISTIHSIDPWRHGGHILVDRATSPLVTRYVAVCQAAADAASKREKIPASRIDIVPIGIPERPLPVESREVIRAELGIPPDAWPVIGILANLRPMKGHRHAVAALPGLLREFPAATMLFAGRDDSNGEIPTLVRDAGLTNQILMPGFVSDSTRVLAAIDMFLLPSDWEGFPVSILEAMHSRVPVIATSVGGIPEMIRQGQDGILIPPGQPGEIERAVTHLANDWAVRAAMVRSAHIRAMTEFSRDIMVNRMERIFAQTLEKS